MTAETKPTSLLAQVTARQAFVATVVVLSVGLAIWLLVAEQAILFSLFVAIVISTAMAPGVDWLHARGLPRAAGVVLIFGLLFVLLIVIALLVVPVVAEQGAAVSARFGGVYFDVLRTLRLSPSRLIRRLAWQLPGTVDVTPAPAEAEADPFAAVGQALELADQVADGFFVFVAVLLLAFYWTLERERIVRSGLLLTPLNQRDNLRELFEAAETKVGGYVRGVFILCLIVGSLALVAFLALGVPYALLLAIVAGIMEAVPVLGPALGVLPAFVVTLAVDPSRAMWVVVLFAGIQLLENTVLVPRVMGRTVGVNPVVTLLALLGFSTLFGVAGALLAIPLAAVVQLLIDRYVLSPAAVEQQEPEGRGHLSVLRLEAQELMQDVRKHLREKPEGLDDEADEVEDAIEALAADVDSFIARNAPDGMAA